MDVERTTALNIGSLSVDDGLERQFKPGDVVHLLGQEVGWGMTVEGVVAATPGGRPASVTVVWINIEGKLQREIIAAVALEPWPVPTIPAVAKVARLRK